MKHFDDLDRILGQSPSAAQPSRERPVVYVIDDDQAVRDALALAFGEECIVRTFATGREGISAVVKATEEITCVILDVKMGELDGFATCEKLQEYDSSLPIVFHSAYQDIKDPFAIINEYHPFAFITKDGDTQRLRKVIERAVRHGAVVRAKRRTTSSVSETMSTLARAREGR